MDMQTSLFSEKNDLQGLQPLEVKRTTPQAKSRRYATKTIYAYSIKTSRVKEPDFPYKGQSFNGTNELLAFARSLQDLDIEKFVVLYLDGQNSLICVQITAGTVNQAYVYYREVIRHALLVGSSAVILIHNHPSGVPRPSDADIRLTNKIKEASGLFEILVHDHLIIGADTGRFYSFREEGLM